MRVGRVERRHDLGVVPARLAVAEELDPLDLEFGGAGLRLEQREKLQLLALLGQQRFTV